MRAATVVQQLCKCCRTTCFKFYCMFYFTCDRCFSGCCGKDVAVIHTALTSNEARCAASGRMLLAGYRLYTERQATEASGISTTQLVNCDVACPPSSLAAVVLSAGGYGEVGLSFLLRAPLRRMWFEFDVEGNGNHTELAYCPLPISRLVWQIDRRC